MTSTMFNTFVRTLRIYPSGTVIQYLNRSSIDNVPVHLNNVSSSSTVPSYMSNNDDIRIEYVNSLVGYILIHFRFTLLHHPHSLSRNTDNISHTELPAVLYILPNGVHKVPEVYLYVSFSNAQDTNEEINSSSEIPSPSSIESNNINIIPYLSYSNIQNQITKNMKYPMHNKDSGSNESIPSLGDYLHITLEDHPYLAIPSLRLHPCMMPTILEEIYTAVKPEIYNPPLSPYVHPLTNNSTTSTNNDTPPSFPPPTAAVISLSQLIVFLSFILPSVGLKLNSLLIPEILEKIVKDNN